MKCTSEELSIVSIGVMKSVLYVFQSVGTSNATPERIFSRVTWQSSGRPSYMSMRRLDQVVRIQELGLPPKKQDMAFWRKVKAEL